MQIWKFYTPWCNPCKTLDGIMENVDLKGAEIVKIDADASKETAELYGVMGVPVLIFVKDGQEVDRINGIVPAEAIQERIDKHV